MQFKCHCSDPLRLRERPEQFANEQWVPAHVTRDEAAEIVLDQFKRSIVHTLELLELHVEQ